MNKIDELKHCISIYDNIDFVCVTETHLNNSVLDSELSIDGYKFFRKDRNFDIHVQGYDFNGDISGGGGSMIYYKDILHVSLVKSFYNNAPDSLAIEVRSSVGQFCIACVYRSPNLSKSLNNTLLACINPFIPEVDIYAHSSD